ncbi:L,D-transpeptidase family protein [Desmospora activa]|uniref:Putative peptidoglycan binding protein n=1 Tax=Desmospora activa DSM 45169 TaxID=1121389 RepID=A0A2T4Z786_9BACL|nr:L,D-transpeptidase family protein [Desmospora activa]PTM57756.1 putative peptidoglycan binding protein [Desmospora activa DSM 45169]
MKRWLVGWAAFAYLLFAIVPVHALGKPDIEKDRWVKIDLWQRRLYIVEGDRILEAFPIATGREQFPTPIGKWKIIKKSKGWGGGFGTRWLGLNVPWGMYGIHGTNRPASIGRDASHGCIRMLNPDVEQLYQRIPVGATVHIEGPIFGREDWKFKPLVKGDRGTLVMLVQNRLGTAGYYQGPFDGIFGRTLESAVKRYQRDHHLSVTGQIHLPEYLQFGLLE